MQVYVQTRCVAVMFGTTRMVCESRTEANKLLEQAKSWGLKAYIIGQKKKKVGTKHGDVTVTKGKAARKLCKG